MTDAVMIVVECSRRWCDHTGEVGSKVVGLRVLMTDDRQATWLQRRDIIGNLIAAISIIVRAGVRYKTLLQDERGDASALYDYT